MNIIIDIGGVNKALTIKEAKDLCNKMLDNVKEFDIMIDGEEHTIFPCEVKRLCKDIHEQLYV